MRKRLSTFLVLFAAPAVVFADVNMRRAQYYGDDSGSGGVEGVILLAIIFGACKLWDSYLSDRHKKIVTTYCMSVLLLSPALPIPFIVGIAVTALFDLPIVVAFLIPALYLFGGGAAMAHHELTNQDSK